MKFFQSLEGIQSYKCKECGHSGSVRGKLAVEVKNTGLCPNCLKKKRKEQAEGKKK